MVMLDGRRAVRSPRKVQKCYLCLRNKLLSLPQEGHEGLEDRIL